MPTIIGEIKRYFRDRAWSVRVRRELQERALRVERVVGELTRETRPPAVRRGGGAQHGIDAEDVLEAMQADGAYRAMSLDAPRTGDEHGGTLGDTIGRVEEGYADAEHRAVLQTLMRSLTLRERNVIRSALRA